MRVIAGKYKRRKLLTPTGTAITRPTADRVKESLFSIIAGNMPQARVLDLFSGSGALGIEALSRGARHVTFVEQNSAALRAIQENIQSLAIPREQYRIVNVRVEEFLAKRTSAHKADLAVSFDLVLADPPYDSPWYNVSIEQLELSGWCQPDCLFVLETSANRAPLAESILRWQRIDSRTYGAARLEFWQRRDEEDNNHEISTKDSKINC